ncbi:14-3-3 protein, putative [Eimeria tenella]|uniref:14-3-3 protein, putative n=1 Tax=Eimeria tenella TaxID=5802 RepID=U6KGE5_EIMTE|nr:14-3-3 protein, putative [Eimeria tenella]CDJ37019.1 14-3-3 protein, putative [Eimeria tenella]|eukprot:XP_013227857.1 14-3-3 protein, putative [Eimeria tenella]
MASGATGRGPWWPGEANDAAAAAAFLPRLLQQPAHAVADFQRQQQAHEQLQHLQQQQLQQLQQQQLQQQQLEQLRLQQQHRPRTVAWQPSGSTDDEPNSAYYEAQAKIEVTAHCRPKEEIFQAFKEAIRMRPVLSAKHRELLANTVKGLVTDRQVSYQMVSAMGAAMKAAAAAWSAAGEKGAAAAVQLAAAAAAAALTAAGVSPQEAGQLAADTALTRGVGAARNLVLQHKVQQQRQQNAAAAAAALERAQAAAAAAAAADRDDSSSSGTEESSGDLFGSSGADSSSSSSSSSSGIAPDSAAALSRGVPIPQQLMEAAAAAELLPFAAYFQKRIEFFLKQLIKEVQDLSRKIHRVVKAMLLPNADSTEAKVFYLQLDADVARYAAQIATDGEEVEEFRKMSLELYRTALSLLQQNQKEINEAEEQSQTDIEDQVPLSLKMGLVLNYAVLLHDEPDGAEQAINALAAQFREAVENVVHISDTEESRRVVMVMSLLRGNVEAWCAEANRKDATKLLGLDGSAALLM